MLLVDVVFMHPVSVDFFHSTFALLLLFLASKNYALPNSLIKANPITKSCVLYPESDKLSQNHKHPKKNLKKS